jgi:hypothetical protein
LNLAQPLRYQHLIGCGPLRQVLLVGKSVPIVGEPEGEANVVLSRGYWSSQGEASAHRDGLTPHQVGLDIQTNRMGGQGETQKAELARSYIGQVRHQRSVAAVDQADELRRLYLLLPLIYASDDQGLMFYLHHRNVLGRLIDGQLYWPIQVFSSQ